MFVSKKNHQVVWHSYKVPSCELDYNILFGWPQSWRVPKGQTFTFKMPPDSFESTQIQSAFWMRVLESSLRKSDIPSGAFRGLLLYPNTHHQIHPNTGETLLPTWKVTLLITTQVMTSTGFQRGFL